jgi:hypothetical protein
MYARASYITAVGFVELPYIIAQTLVFVPVAYFMIGEPSQSLAARIVRTIGSCGVDQAACG